MGCGCNKGRKAAQPKTATQTPAPGRAVNGVPANQTGSTGNKTTQSTQGRTQQFALDLSNGQTLQFGSKLEADAENVRRGYTGRVRRA